MRPAGISRTPCVHRPLRRISLPFARASFFLPLPPPCLSAFRSRFLLLTASFCFPLPPPCLSAFRPRLLLLAASFYLPSCLSAPLPPSFCLALCTRRAAGSGPSAGFGVAAASTAAGGIAPPHSPPTRTHWWDAGGGCVDGVCGWFVDGMMQSCFVGTDAGSRSRDAP